MVQVDEDVATNVVRADPLHGGNAKDELVADEEAKRLLGQDTVESRLHVPRTMQRRSAEPPTTQESVVAPLTSAARPGVGSGHSPDERRARMSQRRCSELKPEAAARVLPN